VVRKRGVKSDRKKVPMSLKREYVGLFCLFLLVLFMGCEKTVQYEETDAPGYVEFCGDPQPVKMTPRSALPSTKWTPWTHNNVTSVCAWQWGLSSTRVCVMKCASELPDEYQSGISQLYNQQWSHAWLINSAGNWVWGDADDDLHDNIDQYSGEFESPEGYCSRSAKYYYELGDQYMGDWYLGYALHYIEDVSLMLHSTAPTVDMLNHHFDFELWVHNNLSEGHNFLDAVRNDWVYYPVEDLKQAVYDAAYGCCYWTSDLGKRVWDNYRSSGYPTSQGSGNQELVEATREMIIRSARYAKGVIKYALDKYEQWEYSGYTISSNFYFRIKALHSGKVVSVESQSTDDGANIVQWSWTGDANQQWLFESVEPGYYRIIAKHSGKVMDVANGSLDDGANVLQWNYHGADNQRWRIISVGDGYYRIECKASGKVLDVASGSADDGANVLQWSSNGGANQKFRFDPISPAD